MSAQAFRRELFHSGPVSFKAIEHKHQIQSAAEFHWKGNQRAVNDLSRRRFQKLGQILTTSIPSLIARGAVLPLRQLP